MLRLEELVHARRASGIDTGEVHFAAAFDDFRDMRALSWLSVAAGSRDRNRGMARTPSQRCRQLRPVNALDHS